MSCSIIYRRLLHRRLFSTAAVAPSAILSPSDPAAVLTARQKSLAACHLLNQLPRDPASSGGAAAVDPSAVISICSAASLSNSTHVDRVALSRAISLISHSPSSVRSLVSSVLLPSSPSDRQVSHAIVLFGQAGLLNDALSVFKANTSTKALNSLLLAAILSGDHPAAARFFAELPGSHNVTPDIDTYNTMIKSFSESGSTRSVYSLLEEMRMQNLKPNATTFTNALVGFYKEQSFDDVKKILGLMKMHECNPYSLAVYNSRISGLCKLRKSAEAKDLYREILMKKMKPNWVTVNHLIVGFCKEGDLEEAKRMYEEIGKRGIAGAESGLYFCLIHYLCQGEDFEAGLRVCKDVMGKNWVPCFKTMKVLVDGLAKVGNVAEAKELVELMKVKFPSKADTWKEVEEGFPQ